MLIKNEYLLNELYLYRIMRTMRYTNDYEVLTTCNSYNISVQFRRFFIFLSVSVLPNILDSFFSITKNNGSILLSNVNIALKIACNVVFCGPFWQYIVYQIYCFKNASSFTIVFFRFIVYPSLLLLNLNF